MDQMQLWSIQSDMHYEKKAELGRTTDNVIPYLNIHAKNTYSVTEAKTSSS